MGQFEIAKELLTLAKQSGATVGKFQKRCPKELLTDEQYTAPHPNPHNSYGDTYGAHREFLELDVNQHRELKKHCDEIGLLYSCSVWDTTSAREIVSINPPLIKVGSPSNQHWEMQKVLRDEYTGSDRRTKRGFLGEDFVHAPHLSRGQFPPLASPHTKARSHQEASTRRHGSHIDGHDDERRGRENRVVLGAGRG